MSRKKDFACRNVSTRNSPYNLGLIIIRLQIYIDIILQREEIAKQFLLPERQSKIDTLLKQDGQAYCICRSSDSSRFMIACDACEEWLHFISLIKIS